MKRRMRFGIAILSGCGAIGVMVAPAGAASPPSITITSGPYHNGQLINLSVGPNHFFAPYSRVNVIECADPHGSTKNLPTSDAVCDGNTIQGNTILVKKNGSFSEHGYELFALPNTKTLGEELGDQPVCNTKHPCVLYVGQDQNHFSAPKVFSAPITISGSGTKS